MSALDKETVKRIGKRAEEKLKEIEAEFGISVSYGGGRFSKTNATLKFEFALVREDGSVATKEAEDYKRWHGLFGLPADGVGQTFLYQSQEYTIMGILPKSKKYPVITMNSDGRSIKFPAELVKRLLGDVR